MYVDAQVRKARPFQQFKRKCVVVVPTTEEWERRKTLQKESEDATIPDDAMGEMKGEDCCFSRLLSRKPFDCNRYGPPLQWSFL